MTPLLLTIKLLQPLLLAAPAAGEENSAVSLDYIPGSVLRGALVERFRQGNPEANLLDNALARQLFFSNEVRYLNGYLADRNGVRSLPTPASWVVEKESSLDPNATIYDLILQDPAELEEPKSWNAAYSWLEVETNSSDKVEVTITPGKVKRQPQLHNTSAVRFVKRESDSNLFRYEALAADQRFAAVILCAGESLANEVRSLLTSKEFVLGRSRSAGYGRVIIEQAKTPSTWSEYEPMGETDEEQIVLTLLSDLILRDPTHGCYTTNLPAALGIALEPKCAFVSTDVTGGFNRSWGMPLPQCPFLRAGSVWVFNGNDDVRKQLLALEKTGIGERRNEGFGRIAINWQSQSEFKQQKPLSSPSSSQPIQLSGANATLAQAMANRIYRQQLEDLLLERATGAMQIQGTVENAQLSRLRTIALQAAQAQQPAIVTDFLKSLRDNAKKQFRRARLDGKSLLRWLEDGWKEGGEKEEGLWRKYFYIEPGRLPKVGNVTARVDEALRFEYMARLVDVVCKRAIQKQQDEEQRRRAA
ncbi:MAG: hypothetical protein U0175_21010 [Caldilineaceae bacterium]